MCPDSGLISELRRYWELARSQARENLLRFFDEGSPVLSGDIELIADYSQRFRDIADHLLACHQQNNGEEFQSPCTFSELEHCEQQYLLKSSRLRHTEIILEKLAGAHHAAESEFMPLRQVREQALNLQRGLKGSEASQVLQSLIAGQHPLLCLFELIENSAELDDSRADTLVSIVRDAFGGSLATAVLRARIALPNEIQTAGTESPDTESTGSISLQEPSPPSPAQSDANSVVDEESNMINTDFRRGENTVQIIETAQQESVYDASEAPSSAVPKEIHVPAQETALNESSRPQAPAAEQNDTPRRCSTPDARAGNHIDRNLVETKAWTLIQEGCAGLAAHILKPEAEQTTEVKLPSLAIEIYQLGVNLIETSGLSATGLAPRITEYLTNTLQTFPNISIETNVLLLAACIRPALFAPHTLASDLLPTLRLSDMAGLYRYKESIGEFAGQKQPLILEFLQNGNNTNYLETQLSHLRASVERWREQSLLRRMISGSATDVWRKWLEPKGEIFELLHPILSDGSGGCDLEKAAKLKSRDYVERAVNETHDAIRRTKRLPRRFVIEAKAVGQIIKHLEEVQNYVHSFEELRSRQAAAKSASTSKFACSLRDDLRRLVPDALADLEQFRTSQGHNVAASAAALLCQSAIRGLSEILDGRKAAAEPNVSLDTLLNHQLLLFPDVQWTGDELAGPLSETVWERIFQFSGSPRWRSAFELQCEAKRGDNLDRLIDLAEHNVITDIPLDDWKERRDALADRWRLDLSRACEETEKNLHDAFAIGLLQQKERDDIQLRLHAIQSSIQKIRDFHHAFRQLESMGSRIEEKKKTELQKARERLNALSESRPDEIEAIQSLIDQDDVVTAREYMDELERGRPIPRLEAKGAFWQFFPERLRLFCSFLDDPRALMTAAEKIKNRDILIGFDLKSFNAELAAKTANLLQTWHLLKDPRLETSKQLEYASDVLEGIGFAAGKPSNLPKQNHIVFEFRTACTSDRNRIPIAWFGSDAKGRYRLLLVWDEPDGEKLLNEAGSLLQDPLLVFYFGKLSEARRRELARLCIERQKTVVVLDDALLLWLCVQSGDRLPMFFSCSLPFTSATPYTTTAGLLAPEMFYGRNEERRSIQDPNGSNFVFGGRQLGKTVLLRDVQREFHRPDEGRISCWIDLKDQRIGISKEPDEIFSVIADELKRTGVQPLSDLQRSFRAERIFETITKWLNGDTSRRILLLLDEADHFLDVDGKERKPGQAASAFSISTTLKGWMDRTNRRFKVVFAGLHNVQRTTTQANHPLAHFGSPVCIGPLTEGRERSAAQALIVKPLEALGYEFEDIRLVYRILGQTNYYPSLIQLYCSELLRHLRDRKQQRFDVRTCPPYVITHRHVSDAYKSQGLQQAIKERLQFTLQLDPRYEVIALVIAHLYLDDESDAAPLGFTVTTIREHCICYWAKGFADSKAEDSFAVLLEEMVGLGILRQVQPGRYTLRSPNLIDLMGTKPQIEEALLRERTVPPVYVAGETRSSGFHKGSTNTRDSSRLSPMTAAQESELLKNGVTILVGSEISDLESVPTFLENAGDRGLFLDVETKLDLGSFSRTLKHKKDYRAENKHTVVLVGHEISWNESWVDEALRTTERLKSPTTTLHVNFLADSRQLWQLLGKDGSGLNRFRSKGVRIASLKPWTESVLHHWLEDLHQPSNSEIISRMSELTGRWPTLVYLLREKLGERGRSLNTALVSLADDAQRPTFIDRILKQSGFDPDMDPITDLRELVIDLAIGDSTTKNHLCGPTRDLDFVSKSLQWAELLGIVEQEGDDRWRLVKPFS